MPERFIVTVYDVEISRLFDAMGTVGRPMTRLQREIYAEAILAAPSRSGELKASHRNKGARKAGPYRIRGFIENTSAHAEFVYKGTHGPIFPRRRRFLRFPGRGGVGFTYKRWVRGQRANPWMERAARTVLSRHGI